MNLRKGWLAAGVAMLALAFACGPTGVAHAVVAQNIIVDGVNDFDPSNLVEDDGGDTEIKDWCTGTPGIEAPMDLGKVFVTNDNVNIYFGFFYNNYCFTSPQVNLGMAIDVNGAFGGTTDPFNRKIGWTTIAQKPDLVMYDVLDGFNFEALYQWTGSSWSNIASTFRPGYGGGSNGLGIVEGTGFVEYALPLSVLGSPAPGTAIRLEWWMTQDGTTKGPLDAIVSDAVQMSRATGTTFDTTAVVEMVGYKTYTIQAFTDNTPPTVQSASATAFNTLANQSIAVNTDSILVVFSEPVDLTTGQNIANYALSNAGAVTVAAATRNSLAPNVVTLRLSGNIGASANPYGVTVTNVKDLNNNTIVANGTTNTAGFHIQALTFRGNMKVGLCKGVFAQTDSFYVEGNLVPLTFAAADNARMLDPEGDSTYVTTVAFSIPRDRNTGAATASLQWKFYRKNTGTGAAEYEPRGNRLYTLDGANGASVTLDGFWNDDDPANFTTGPVDVTFRVNATKFGPGIADVVTLLGAESPLSFTQPGLPMTAVGGGIYERTVRFPRCSRKTIEWKVDYNGVFECANQGNRVTVIDEAVVDTVGGVKGPLVTPARSIDRCSVTDKAVAVTFRADMFVIDPNPGPTDTVRVHVFSQPAPVAQMFDNGVAPDALNGDQIFSRTIVFPDSSDLNVTYKYAYKGEFECFGANDRSFTIDDVVYSVANPQVRPINQWNYCTDNRVDVPRDPAAAGSRLALYQNVPNPAYRAGTTIAFELPRSGRVTMGIYDVAGRRIATLVDRDLPAGSHRVAWDGRGADGAAVPAGVYFYDLAQGGERTAKRMVVVGR